MRLFKGFKPDMSCRSFKFQEGTTYHEKTARLCESGFHACTKPTDTFGYYPPNKSVYHEVEMDQITSEKGEDTKVCSTDITVSKRMSVEDLIREERAYATGKRRCLYLGTCRKSGRSSERFVQAFDADDDAYSGDRSVSITSECCERAITGNRSIAKAGNFGHAISGYNSISETGYHGLAVCKGNGKAISGDFGTSISYHGSCLTGRHGTAIADRYVKAGDRSIIILNSISNAVVKAGINSVIMYKTANGPVSFKIDGVKYKPDVWYEIELQFDRYELVEADKIDSAEAEAYFEGE